MATEVQTNLAIHPGEYLRDELAARKLTQAELARQMGRPARVVNDICRERRNISAATALDLEHALDGLTAQTWLNLQTQFDLTVERLQREAKSGAASAAP